VTSVALHSGGVITSFRSKALARLYEADNGKGLPAKYVDRIRRIILALDAAEVPDDLRQPGFGLHALSGDRNGQWSIVVSRNWRIVFSFNGTNVADVEMIDYH
jgi:toxin HigB-1